MRYRWRATAALVALIVAAAATLVVPIAVRRMVDFGFTERGLTLINNYFLAMIGVAAVLALASASRYFLVTTLGERVVADLRGDVFAHLTALSADFFDEAKTGEITSRLTADTTQIKASVGSSLSIALRNVLLFLGASTMMVVTSPRLAAYIARRHSGDRAAALRLRPRRAPPLALGAGHARRCFRLCDGTDRRGARAASLHQRAPRHRAVSWRGRERLRGRAPFDPRARGPDRPGHFSRCHERHHRFVGRSGRGPWRRRHAGAPHAIHHLRRIGRRCARLVVGNRRRDCGGVRRRRAAVRNPRHQARDHAAGASGRVAVAAARRGRVRGGAVRLSDARQCIGAQQRVVPGAPGREGRNRRALGRRQEYDLQPHPALSTIRPRVVSRSTVCP